MDPDYYKIRNYKDSTPVERGDARGLSDEELEADCFVSLLDLSDISDKPEKR